MPTQQGSKNRIFLGGVLAIFMMAILMVGCSSSTPEEIIDDANRLIAADRSSEAVSAIQEGILEFPDAMELRVALASAYLVSGREDRLFSYLDGGNLDAENSALFYYFLAERAYHQENWIRTRMLSRRGLEGSPTHCLSAYYLLKNVLAEAYIQLKEFGLMQESFQNIHQKWDSHDCKAQSFVKEFAFEGQVEHELLNEVSNMAAMYAQNESIVSNVRDRLQQFSQMRSDTAIHVNECRGSANQRYLESWASACRDQANQLERQLALCIETSIDRVTEIYDGRDQARRDATRLCQARIGTIDYADTCRLTTPVANRLDAIRERTIRECNELLDIFD